MFKKNDLHQDMDTAKTPFSGMSLVLFVLLMTAVAGVSGTVFFYKKYQALKIHPNSEVTQETSKALAELGRLIALPLNETPTIASISDKEKLKSQIFFQAAENGDLLFAYATSMKAILYRPSINKIINVAPLTINQPEAPVSSTASSKSVRSPLRIAYYNGTASVGLSAEAEKLIQATCSTCQTVSLTKAAKKDYKKTIIVDLTGAHAQDVQEIATILKGQVASMPDGEVKPNADILVISGK